MVKTRGTQQVLRCSFCNKSQEDVRKLIAGPSAFVCDECVDVCNDIIADDASRSAGAGATAGTDPLRRPEGPLSGLAFRCALCGMPATVDDGLLIRDRGVLCPACIGEIETTVAERRQRHS